PDFIKEHLNDICASIQKRIISILINKLEMAAEQTGIKEIAIGGGVSANSGIRAALKQMEGSHGWNTYIPKFEYCTDNGAMIGIVGHLKFLQGDFSKTTIGVKARYRF
ncbi:MAG: tRNA (adenosine(37)-N6)-threonylcarbamoyltransferase complex transferase subunit TsaD, partial [Flavobacteriaceae bacterium]